MKDLSHWNHRVIRKRYPTPDGEILETLGIYEVYYDESHNPVACTTDPVEISTSLFCEDDQERLAELRGELERMQKCLDYPILDMEKDFPDESEEGREPREAGQ